MSNIEMDKLRAQCDEMESLLRYLVRPHEYGKLRMFQGEIVLSSDEIGMINNMIKKIGSIWTKAEYESACARMNKFFASNPPYAIFTDEIKVLQQKTFEYDMRQECKMCNEAKVYCACKDEL